MTIVELETLVKNVDVRLSRVEQILPTLATKDDLGRFATKEDLDRFATKEDLDRFATKDDLRRFATKDDLGAFATKADLKEALAGFATTAEMREEATRTRRHFNAVVERMEGYVRMVAEGHGVLQQRLDETNRRFEDAIARLDRRVMRLESNARR